MHRGATLFEGLLQPTHLILILAIVIVIFGPGKLPDLGKELGKSVRGFREAMHDVTGPLDEVKGTVAEIKDAATLSPKPASKPTAASQPAEPPASKAAQ